MHIGQAVIPTGMAKGQLFVVQSELVQDRGVEIVDVDLVLDARRAVRDGTAARKTDWPNDRQRPPRDNFRVSADLPRPVFGIRSRIVLATGAARNAE